MLLSLFKSKQPVTLVLIFVLTLLLWFNPFANQLVLFNDNSNQMPLFVLSKLIIPGGTTFSRIIGFALIISIALLIIRLNIRYNFFSERSYLPSIIFIMLVVGVANVHDYYSILPASLLFVFSLDKLLQTYKSDSLSYKIFDAGFILGLSALFYFNMVFFIVFIWMALLILRPFYWREWIFSILGLAIPFFITVSIYYLFNIKVPDFNVETTSSLVQAFTDTKFSSLQYLFLGSIFLLVIVASQFLLRTIGTKKIFTRKTFNLFFTLFISSLFLFFLFRSVSSEIIGITAIPLTIVISNYFLQARSSIWMDVFFYIFLISFILTQLIPID